MTRRAILRINADLLAQFLRDGTGLVRVIEHPLPPDAQIVSARMDILTSNMILLHIESATFPEVQDGQPYPQLPAPVFARDEAPCA